MQEGETTRPQVPCHECLIDPKTTWSNGKVTLVYCRHNLSGAVFYSDRKRWVSYSPLSPAEWGEFIQGFLRGLELIVEQLIERRMTGTAGNA